MSAKTDLRIENHGSICLFQPLTVQAKRWIKETAPEDAQFWGSAMVVEPRFAEEVAFAAESEGLSIR